LRKYLLTLILYVFLCPAGFPQVLTNVGTDFWIAFPPNVDMTASLQIFISSNFATSGNVSSAFPGVNQTFTVTPGVVTQLSVPSTVALINGVENKGIRIMSNDPIAVYGLNLKVATTDAYMALPVSSLGIDYMVLTYTTTLNGVGSSFSVVATQNATVLTIFNHQTNSTYTVNLDEGQTYREEVPTVGEDLTGSRIQSNFPVSVYGSVDLANIPAGCTFADHIVEQMFPISAWGKRFVTVPLAGRDASGDIFRILASEDATDVLINGTLVTTINTGDYYETNLVGYNAIEASNACLLAQYAKGTTCSGGTTGDPFIMLIPPREQFLTSYTICTLAGFSTHWVNLVAPSNAVGTIYQDGVLVPAGAFVPIGTTSFYGAQIPISEGSHTFTSTIPFGVFVYGWTNVNSYGYPGGGSMSPVGTVANVTISPATASGILDVTTVCFTAHVEDDFHNPVEGVLVNFMISGCSTLVGNAYTNASGDAQYCYMQSGTVSCVDNVYAEIFGFISTTSTVNWTYQAPCTNPTNGGTIGNDQSGCGTFVPNPIVNITNPSGYSGTLEYKWQVSVTDAVSGFIDIPGSNAATYAPGAISQTSWFRRIARVDCMPDWTGAAGSNAVMLTVLPVLPVAVTIAEDTNLVCQGTPVVFTATPVNAGTNPTYQWQVNGVNAGTNNPVFTYLPMTNDQVQVILTSSEVCTSNNPDTSNSITMVVYPNLPVSVTVTPSANQVCAGTLVTFTATATNGGLLPQYQWKVNGINAGTNDPVFSYNPASLDLVSCILTSSETCTVNNPAASTPVLMTVNPILPVSLTVTPSANPVCAGTLVTFTATPTNGGLNPQYQWQVNGINAGTNNPVFTFIPASLDLVACILTSSEVCTSGNPASGIPILMTVNTVPVVTFTPCFDTVTKTNAKPIRLKGGIPLGGTYTGPGVSAGYYYPNLAGVGTHNITYTYTNATLCSASSISRIHEFANSPFICGNNLTDIRDGKSYPTVQIGGQCWMAADLDYGIQISESMHQRDNCINEKYSYPSSLVPRPSYYQWDELMRYDPTPGQQGLCPPAWHIPTEIEWSILFANWTNSAFAASPLKYSGYSGFNAFLSGARHGTVQWDYQNFAAFFWSSSAYGPYKAWAHGMNDPDPSVSYYPSLRSNAFSVRCLRD